MARGGRLAAAAARAVAGTATAINLVLLRFTGQKKLLLLLLLVFFGPRLPPPPAPSRPPCCFTPLDTVFSHHSVRVRMLGSRGCPGYYPSRLSKSGLLFLRLLMDDDDAPEAFFRGKKKTNKGVCKPAACFGLQVRCG